MNLIKNILNQKTPFERDSKFRSTDFLEEIKTLMEHHYENSEGFRNIIRNNEYELTSNSLEDLPFIPTRLFKLLDLKSIPESDIFKVMTSSGTSGQAVSKIFLDRSSASIQTKVLKHIITSCLGNKRKDMLIIDSEGTIKDRKKFSARTAGILGFSSFGRNHTYALDEGLELNLERVQNFITNYSKDPVFIFGFTFMIWKNFFLKIQSENLNVCLPKNSILLHGGGWKKLLSEQVDNKLFKESLNKIGINNVYDYYGMIEQTGSIFLECNQGYFHCSDYSEIIIRNTLTLEPVAFHQEGIIQVLSLLPTSYPGNSLLTEDLGMILGEDDCKCGRKGKYFAISGRMKESEIRGCSDTRVI
jgi:phenylacetate-coenzyme A ligase PaaK-like adenylate-forming protein